jgi:hypothetical protein
MAFSDPGNGPADGARAPSRRLHASGLTHVYWHAERGQHVLDQARITESPEFSDFGALRSYVLDRLRYPSPQASKAETYSWVPTLYMPTINVERRHSYAEGWRSAEAEADDLSCLIGDIDNKNDERPHASEVEIAAGLGSLVAGQTSIEHFTYTTYSSLAERRKFRLIVETDRNVSRTEQRDIFVLLNERAFGGQGDGSIYDPGDHLYGPPYNTGITVTHGAPLPVDALLQMARDLRTERPELWVPFQRCAKTARSVTPEELAAMKARMADRSARTEFRGIEDPGVFNPAWRDDYPNVVVQGSHYATMLSLLARVWRKTGGRLSYGEMQQVFDEIDALGGYYIARRYPTGKAREMLRFIMSQPVIDEARPSTDSLHWRMQRLQNKLSGGGR